MGDLSIGRIGSIGLAIETSPGAANTTAAVYLPYSDAPTIRGHHEPLEDISATSSRFMDKDSVMGKKWSEGDIQILADTVNSGYFWKMALGNELRATALHTFYMTASGNTPTTATIIHSRGTTDVEQYTYCSIDELNFEISDGIGTLTASLQGKFPTSGAAQTETTTSGTVIAFKDYFVQFGGTLTAAAATATTPLSAFSLTVANNLEVIHRSGNPDVSAIRAKGARVTGSYTLFFENTTDRDYYYSLDKKAMILTASGIGTEYMTVRIPEFRINEAEVETGLDDFYVLTANFVAEDDADVGARLLEVKLNNSKSSDY